MEKKDDFKNVNEVEVEQLSNMSETTDEPERLEETEEPTVLRSAVLCLATVGILAITIGLAIFCFNKTTKKPVDDVSNNEEVTQEPETEETENKPTVDTKPEEEETEPESTEEEPEVVEPEPEETDPEVVESKPEDGEVDFSQYEIYLDLLKDIDYDELKVIVWGNINGKAILSDGDSYEMEKGDALYLYYPQENLIVTANEGIDIYGDFGTDCGFFVLAAGENLEATFNAVAPDGTEYELTVYITKDFEGAGF